MSSDCQDDDELCLWCKKPHHLHMCEQNPLSGVEFGYKLIGYAREGDLTIQPEGNTIFISPDRPFVNWVPIYAKVKL